MNPVGGLRNLEHRVPVDVVSRRGIPSLSFGGRIGIDVTGPRAGNST